MMFGKGVDQLRRIPLAAVMRQTGAQRDRYDKAKWHTPKGAISITGLKFMNWHRSAGGGGAIDLAMHLNDLGFPAAVAWLQRHFPLPPVVEPPPAARHLALPPPDRGRLSAVKHYLVQDRTIPPAMTDSLIASGKLYADRRGNAVFLLLGKENTPVGAELRGTGVTVTALCPGPVHTEFQAKAQRAGGGPDDAPSPVYVPVQQVVRDALAAIESDKPLVIPGFLMKLGMFLVRITPLSILRLAWRFGTKRR